MKNKISVALFLLLTYISIASMALPTVPGTFNIAEHGAVGDGVTLNTKAIQELIDKCAKTGGGTIIVPSGTFLCGAIFLKPSVNIEMQEGSVISGSQNIDDYPRLMTRIEGHFEVWRAALINGDKVDHLHITGKGTLNGNGQPFWKLYYSRASADRSTTNLSVERPRLALIQNSKDVKIDGITFLNSGFWNLHLYRDQQVSVDNCRFQAPNSSIPNNHAPSSDGIDVDSSQDISIGNCYFSVGDDDIALKGSKGPFALEDKDSPPVQHIYVHDCQFKAGGGIITCGSEATVIRDIKVERCTTHGPTVLRLKLRPDTPQQYEDISFKDITIDGPVVILSIAPWTQYFDLKGQAAPKSTVRHISLSNFKGTGNSVGRVRANGNTDFTDLILQNFDVTLKSAEFDVSKFIKTTLENVLINGIAAKSDMQAKN